MRNPLSITLLFVSALGLVGCGGDSDGNGVLPVLAEPGPKLCGFDDIVVTMTMTALPETITYNRDSTPNGRVEYRWDATLDVTRDGAINDDDIVLRVIAYETNGDEQTGTIESLGADVWVYSGGGSITTSKAPITLEQDGNTLIMSARGDAHPALEFVCEDTLVNFSTTVFDEASQTQSNDDVPAFQTLTNVPPNRELTDEADEDLPPEADLVHMEVLLR